MWRRLPDTEVLICTNRVKRNSAFFILICYFAKMEERINKNEYIK